MGKVNLSRVIWGGLLAGLILNLGEFTLNEVLLGKQWESVIKTFNLPPADGATISWFILMGFILGIVTIWLYAAIRPRFGAGPKTAIFAGLVVWFLGWAWGFGWTYITGLYPASLTFSTVIWGFFEVPLAALAGAWLYKED